MANEITQPVLDALVGTVSRGMMDSKLERPPLDQQEPDQERVDTLAAMVEIGGFEPPTPCMPCKCSSS